MKGNTMDENQEETGSQVLQLLAAAATGVAVYATVNFVWKKLDQRKARKEAAANLCSTQD